MSAADMEGASMGDMSTLGRRNDARSPMSAGHLSASTMSMRAKAQRKRRANAQHNSNFRAGYVPVDEEVLHRTGIRGRKRYFLYCTLIILLIVALLNAAVTVWLIYILGMTHNGLTTIELTSMEGRDFMRVLADARIISLSFSDNASLGARYNSSLKMTAEDSKARVMSVGGGRSSVTLEGGNVTVTSDDFSVRTAEGEEPLSPDLPTLTNLGILTNLLVDNVTATEITSVEYISDLYLESALNQVEVTGSEGVEVISGQEVDMKGSEIFLESQTSLIFAAGRGVYVDPAMPQVTTSDPIDPNLLTYKVCVCQSGSLFAVPVTRPGVSCDVGPQIQTLCE
ncbi:beta-sarcoglycan [Aplysia californica]|uniref:Beta-sarcoglycan n=1 Tax=Aplysia californica TaxID=6500 RepID=A0ABM0K4A3_APLCA|nr:beta-sarcoglycan [Aplysia californica]